VTLASKIVHTVGKVLVLGSLSSTVLFDLDTRPQAARVSLDMSSAHDDFQAAAEAVRGLVPEMPPLGCRCSLGVPQTLPP